MIAEIRLAYAAIEADARPPGQGLRIAPVRGAPGVWVGLDREQRPHLLLPHDSDEELPQALDAVDISEQTLELAGSARRVIDVACLVTSMAEVFDQFSAAVVERLVTTREAPRKVLDLVLRRWRRFLHVSSPASLGREGAAALIGELLVLLDLTRADAEAGIRAWLGPAKAPHDFRGGAAAVEVKTTLSASSNVVTIHGVTQFEQPQDGSLHVHFVRLETVPGGRLTVSALVRSILDAGADPSDLYGSLGQLGIDAGVLHASDQHTFELRQRATLPVDGRIPRIVRASFVCGSEPAGVTGIEYTVDLSSYFGLALDEPAWNEVIRAITSGVSHDQT